MTSVDPLVAATRRHLEAAHGLALDGLTEDQIAMAIEGAARLGPPADPADTGWLARVVDQLPIDESWLFRDDDLWTFLQDTAGPALLERALTHARPLRVLSLGCSSGQEPFSLAILFQGLLEGTGIPASAASAFVQVVGVDASPARIALARSGVLNGWSVQRSRPDRLRGRLALEDAQLGRYRIQPSVLAMCRFEVGNLLDWVARGNAALGGADLVLCRNVLIYFRPAEAERIAADLARALDPGALLAFSAAEAHLLAASGTVEPLGQLGVGRAGCAPAARVSPTRRRARRASSVPDSVPGSVHGSLPSSVPTSAAGSAPGSVPGSGPGSVPDSVRGPAPRRAAGDAVASQVRIAVEHARAGRSDEALVAARAALFHDPRLLFPRLLVAEHLMAIDAARGRQMLEELLAEAARLPRDATVPLADGLSVGQLAHAARLLLGSTEAT